MMFKNTMAGHVTDGLLTVVTKHHLSSLFLWSTPCLFARWLACSPLFSHLDVRSGMKLISLGHGWTAPCSSCEASQFNAAAFSKGCQLATFACLGRGPAALWGKCD